LIVIDYLQLVEGADSDDRREAEIAKISRQIKGLARDLNRPVIALSQLNRKAEHDNKRPTLANLRESGAIGNDADVVLLIHRPDFHDPSAANNVAELIFAKNRNGERTTVKAKFNGSLVRFESIDTTPYI
jgi:replicative DNA helicase